MERIWFSVDFNELIDRDLVMLSQSGTRLDSRGRPVTLYEGLPVTVYEWFCRFDPESFQNSPERRGELPET